MGHDPKTLINKGSGRDLTLPVAQSHNAKNGRGDRIIPPIGGLCEFGFALVLRLRAGSQTEVLILSKIGATGFELEARAS